ncbi:hypothetical protein [Sediminicoccus sp. KRV36]|uniref:hypothetical protein n=1 Tax=Sediminicoccus sp. KRV36 TaxID=3133721 RepID=UPI00200DBFC6|nr:hypothetical protein [Sediminicoccus rosea]UPY37861.1 hypothetical protein LHU95_03975 [Sediminicoccus rosea]
MRPLLSFPILAFPTLLALPGCDATSLAVGAAVNVASVTLVGRSVPDIVVSGLSGRDCSIVRLDRRLSYCGPSEAPPAAPPYCTRSLGQVDCWVTRPASIPMQRGVVDGPTSLNAAQEADRTAWWPGLPRDLLRIEPLVEP